MKNIKQESARLIKDDLKATPPISLQLYVLAIIQFFGSEEEPISVKGIKEELSRIAQGDPEFSFGVTTLYACLRTLREAFSDDPFAAHSSSRQIPSTLAEFYGGTISCYVRSTRQERNQGKGKFVKVAVRTLHDESGRQEVFYAFRGRFSEGEVQMLKASVIANQCLSADTTEHLIRELNRIRSAARSERIARNEYYYADAHKEDKLGVAREKTDVPCVKHVKRGRAKQEDSEEDGQEAAAEQKLRPYGSDWVQKYEDAVAARISLLLDAIHEKRKVRMLYGTYALEEETARNRQDIRKKENGQYTQADLPKWRKKNYYLTLQPDKCEPALFSPFAVFGANGYYYLIAHAQGHGVYYRNYRIDRIISLEMAEEASEPMPDELQAYCRHNPFNAVEFRNQHPVMYGGAPSHFHLRCQKRVLNNLVDVFGTRFYVLRKENEEGEDSYLIDVNASEEGIITFCMQYGEFCQLVDAPATEEKICKKLDAMRAKYLSRREASAEK